MTNLLCLAVVILSILGITTVTGKGLLFKHKAKNGDTKFDDCEDCFEQYNTTYLYNVYEQSFDKIFVCSNGYVTLGAGLPWHIPTRNPVAFPGRVVVAPYWSDNYPPADVRRSHIWYREETENEKLLNKAQKVIEDHFGDCGDNFEPEALFIVTWSRQPSLCDIFNITEDMYENYDYYNDYYYLRAYNHYYDKRSIPDLPSPTEIKDQILSRSLSLGKSNDELELNSYQLVLATDGSDTYVIFNMHTIEWTRCWRDNQMMFNAGDGVRSYVHPDQTAAGLVEDTNVGLNGRWAYKISGEHILGPNCQRP